MTNLRTEQCLWLKPGRFGHDLPLRSDRLLWTECCPSKIIWWTLQSAPFLPITNIGIFIIRYVSQYFSWVLIWDYDV